MVGPGSCPPPRDREQTMKRTETRPSRPKAAKDASRPPKNATFQSVGILRADADKIRPKSLHFAEECHETERWHPSAPGWHSSERRRQLTKAPADNIAARAGNLPAGLDRRVQSPQGLENANSSPSAKYGHPESCPSVSSMAPGCWCYRPAANGRSFGAATCGSGATGCSGADCDDQTQ